MIVKTSVKDMDKRHTPLSYSDKRIYLNGADNLYPNSIERVINNSPTAKRCAVLMSKYISGKGFKDESQNVIIDPLKNIYLSDVKRKIAWDIATQYGSFIHVSYKLNNKAEIVVDKIKVLDYLKCRISKEDDNYNYGKIYYRDYDRGFYAFNEKKETFFYPYNNNKDVITEQIRQDYEESKIKNKKEFNLKDAIEAYRGQVYYLNLSPYVYALSPVDSVYNDADTEYMISVYGNKQSRRGFLGKLIAVYGNLSDESKKNIEDNLDKLLGADSSSGYMSIQVDAMAELENVVKFIQLQPQFDDKLFELTDARIKKNILGAFNNAPEPLIFSNTGALFSSSSSAYIENQKFYSDQTEDERNELIKTLKMFGYNIELKKFGYDNDN